MNLIPWRRKREEDQSNTATRNPLGLFRDEVDDLFERAMRDPWHLATTDIFDRSAPAADLEESDEEVRLTMDVPGVEPGEIKVSLAGGVLTVRAEHADEQKHARGDMHLVERRFGSFHRSIPLPNTINPERVEANCRNGVLTVTVAKRPDARPRQITVRNA